MEIFQKLACDPYPNTVFSSYAPDRIDLFIDSIKSKSSVSGVLM